MELFTVKTIDDVKIIRLNRELQLNDVVVQKSSYSTDATLKDSGVMTVTIDDLKITENFTIQMSPIDYRGCKTSESRKRKLDKVTLEHQERVKVKLETRTNEALERLNERVRLIVDDKNSKQFRLITEDILSANLQDFQSEYIISMEMVSQYNDATALLPEMAVITRQIKNLREKLDALRDKEQSFKRELLERYMAKIGVTSEELAPFVEVNNRERMVRRRMF